MTCEPHPADTHELVLFTLKMNLATTGISLHLGMHRVNLLANPVKALCLTSQPQTKYILKERHTLSLEPLGMKECRKDLGDCVCF